MSEESDRGLKQDAMHMLKDMAKQQQHGGNSGSGGSSSQHGSSSSQFLMQQAQNMMGGGQQHGNFGSGIITKVVVIQCTRDNITRVVVIKREIINLNHIHLDLAG